MGKRTPSTSAIYETLRRSKELRESLSRPGSRMSMDNIPDKLKEPVSILLNKTTPFFYYSTKLKHKFFYSHGLDLDNQT